MFRIDSSGNVLSGNFSAGIKNADLAQDVEVNPDCRYEFSFSARTNVREATLTALVYFVLDNGEEIEATRISIGAFNLPIADGSFNYYRRILPPTPFNAIAARIIFRGTTPGIPIQYVFVDDVSLNGI